MASQVRELLQHLKNSKDGTQLLTQYCYGGFTDDQIAAFKEKGFDIYKGKVRELMVSNDDLLIFHTDRLSAFDRYIGLIPFKGIILAKISEFWLKEAQKIVPTHLLDAPQERVLKVEKMEPVKAEVIIRGYMTGSMQRAYLRGERNFCGQQLPEGLTPSCELSAPLITPTTKAAVFEHDEDISPAELIQRGVCTREEWDQISSMAIKLFQYGQKVYRDMGWILVDTKYEFGRTKDGQIKIIDEVHTPDSSRLWVAGSYQERVKAGQDPEMLDKEIIRRYLMEQGFSGEGPVPAVPVERLVALAEVYLKVAETLLGHPLEFHGNLDTYLQQLFGHKN
jgi:phosphoribosylaminoimidazole-succinocarboxamide synthase